MKKLTIIISLIIVSAVAATSWKFHQYNEATRETLELENEYTRMAINTTETIMHRHEKLITELESRIKTLTNHPAAAGKGDNI